MRATSATVLVIFSKVSFPKFPDNIILKFLLNNYDNYEVFEWHPTVEDFTDMDQDFIILSSRL